MSPRPTSPPPVPGGTATVARSASPRGGMPVSLRDGLGAVFEEENRCLVERTIPTDDHVAASGRVMEVLSEHNCEGWLEGYVLTGRHGIFATYEAFALIVASMVKVFLRVLSRVVQD